MQTGSGTTKQCAYAKCNSDTRYGHRPEMADVFFLRFPRQDKEKCTRWAKACGRVGFDVGRVKKDTYICSKHFVGGEGPTDHHPDPIPMNATKYDVFSRFYHLGLSIGIKGTTHDLDRIKKNYDASVLKWRRQITDYLLLPSDKETSTSATVSDEDIESDASLSEAPPIPVGDVINEVEPMVISPQQGERQQSI